MDYLSLTALILVLIFYILISASDVAFRSISISGADIPDIKKFLSPTIVRKLLSDPASIYSTAFVAKLISGIVFLVLAVVIASDIPFLSDDPVLLWSTAGIFSFFVLLFAGEIVAVIWASEARFVIIRITSIPFYILYNLLWPFSVLLSLSIKKNRRGMKKEITLNELTQSIDIVSDNLPDEGKMLKGIVNIRNTYVKEIMQPRPDVVSLDISTGFEKVTSVVIESGFSRIPVVSGDLDKIQGVLFIKDLIPHIGKAGYKWQELIRPAHFVPENKTINDLLSEFKAKKIHLAVVVDEHGGSSGIVTLEDILEEIVGDITDESDTEEPDFIKVDENCWIFEAKIQLIDFYRAMEIEDDIFEKERGETDSLGGLILEKIGRIPDKNEEISIGNFIFRIKSADNRRIKQIYVKLNKTDEQ